MLALGEFGDPDAFAGWILGRVTGILQEQSKPLTVEPSMPAFRGKNFRSGDLAEQLGLLLLQSLALVAPVPRTEDIGIDAVVTLLEDFDKYRFKASNSFYVQLKSTSVTSIAYMNDEVDWLFALELPFFVAEVDRTLNRIKLYCCHALHEAFVVNPRRARLCLEFENGICEGDFVSAGETIHIGPPICSWSMDDIETKEDLRAQFNAICKPIYRRQKLPWNYAASAGLKPWYGGRTNCPRYADGNPCFPTNRTGSSEPATWPCRIWCHSWTYAFNTKTTTGSAKYCG